MKNDQQMLLYGSIFHQLIALQDKLISSHILYHIQTYGEKDQTIILVGYLETSDSLNPS